MSISARQRAVSSSLWYRACSLRIWELLIWDRFRLQSTKCSESLRKLRKSEGPLFFKHVMTTKGKGYEPAETAPDKFHGIGPFERKVANYLQKRWRYLYRCIWKVLCDGASGIQILYNYSCYGRWNRTFSFKKHYPDRFLMLNAEEHGGVTFAAGLAAGGLKPVLQSILHFAKRL